MKIRGVLYTTCPVKLITSESVELLRLHRHYLRGHLPVVGGMMDQSGYFYDAMTCLESSNDD